MLAPRFKWCAIGPPHRPNASIFCGMHEEIVCALFMNRPVRTRMPGGAGMAG